MAIDPKSNYYDCGGIEVMPIVKAKLTEEQFTGAMLSNIIKYACRCNFKGSFQRDVEKIKVYATLLDEVVNPIKEPAEEPPEAEVIKAPENAPHILALCSALAAYRKSLETQDDCNQVPGVSENVCA